MMANFRVKRVLLCRPTYFDIDYVINPHMKLHSVDKIKAMQQWQLLVDVLVELGIQVEVIEQRKGLPDMVFAADQGIVRSGTVLLANFRYPERAKESIYYQRWFKEHGFRLRELPAPASFEGGDALFIGNLLFVGTGFRASSESCQELARLIGIEVFPLELIDPYFYHLDMSFLPINASTAFFYPPAYSEQSRQLLEEKVPNLLKLTAEAAQAFAANSFVSGNDIIIPTATPSSFRESLADFGLQAHEVDISEFKKSGGGLHCLINVLESV